MKILYIPKSQAFSNNFYIFSSYPLNPNPALPAAFISFFRRIFFMAIAMKIHLKKNAAANGLALKKRLQGLTATDVTHSRESKAAILIFYI
jgi:hypothetical protein